MTKMDVKELILVLEDGLDVQFDDCMVPNEVLRNMPIMVLLLWFERSDIVTPSLIPKQSKKDVDKTS